MRRFLSALVVLGFVLTGEASASDCANSENGVDFLEVIKGDFNSGEFEGLLELANGANTGGSDAASDIVDQLKSVFPSGFAACFTAVRNRYSARMIEELVVFETRDEKAVFLFWIVVEMRGGWQVWQYQISSDFGEILDAWKN